MGQDPLRESIFRSFKTSDKCFRSARSNKLVQPQSCEINQSNERVVGLFKGIAVDTLLERVEIVLPFHLVILIKIEKLRQLLPKEFVKDVPRKPMLIDTR